MPTGLDGIIYFVDLVVCVDRKVIHYTQCSGHSGQKRPTGHLKKKKKKKEAF